jgi:hypothetical protein
VKMSGAMQYNIAMQHLAFYITRGLRKGAYSR